MTRPRAQRRRPGGHVAGIADHRDGTATLTLHSGAAVTGPLDVIVTLCGTAADIEHTRHRPAGAVLTSA